MAELTTIKDRIYENRRLTVDGGRFIRCRFVQSKIIYDATAEVSFEECSFEGCDWVFQNAADRTLRYLSMLIHQGGVEGNAVVGATIRALENEPEMETMTAVSVAS